MTNEYLEYYSSAFNAQCSRIDNPVRNPGLPYIYDAKKFIQNKRRKQFIRKIQPCEFGTTFSCNSNIPDRYVLVRWLGPGVHLVMIVWVGKHSYNLEQNTDSEITIVLDDMYQRGGMDRDYVREFRKAWKLNDDATVAARNGVIN